MQGVRQLGPREVFASAPGGSDSIVSDTLAPPMMLLGRKSQLGVHDAQPATNRALATAHTRTIGIMFTTVSPVAPGCPPARTIRGGRLPRNRSSTRSADPPSQGSAPSYCEIKSYRLCGSR